MRRTSSPLALAFLAALASACSADRTTGPALMSTLAAVAGSDPSPLNAGPISNVAISMGWTDNSPNEAGYEIHRSTTGSTGTFTLVATTSANATSYVDASLTANTQYCYKVRAYRMQGGKPTYSAFSNTVCATTFGPPAAPATITAAPGESGTVTVGWSGSPTATSYRVERASIPAGPWTAVASNLNTLPYIDQGRPLEQQVCYRVAAVNQWGEGMSASRCTAPPAPPTDLVVSAPSGGGLDLRWTDASAVEGGYEVQRAVSDYLFTTVGATAANATSYHDGTALNDTRYWYRVRATKDGGYSQFSALADGIAASAAPAAPTLLTDIPLSSTVVAVGWVAGTGSVAGFRVERSVNGGAWTTIATATWAESQAYDQAATPEVEGCYRVIAFNGVGDSPPSSSDCARTLAAPTNVAAAAVGSDAIDVTWNDASAFETGYVVDRIECSTGYYGYTYCNAVESVTLPAGATSWRSANLVPGQSYDYQVYAIGNKNGQTYSSDAIPVSGSTPP